MTKEAAIENLKKQQSSCDKEEAHIEADKILCELLISLGHGDIVNEYHKIQKWFA